MLSMKFKTIARRICAAIPALLFFAAHPIFAAGYGLDQTANAAKIPISGDINLAGRIGMILGTALSLVGVVFLVLMVYGGFLWMTSAGDSEKVKKAKGLITSAIIGIIIIASGYIITNFILTEVLKATQ